MNEATGSSRRTFIGLATGAVAVTGALALFGDSLTGVAGDDVGRITVLPGESLVTAPVTGVGDPWTAALGQPVRIAGETGPTDGIVAAVVRGPLGPMRAAGLRQRSLLVYFEMDVRGAPVGNRIYDIGQTIDGLSQLFLTRGLDRAGKAILMAVLY